MNYGFNVLGICLLAFFLFGLPIFSVGFLFYYGRKPASRGRRIALMISGGALLAWLGLIGAHVVEVGPWRSGILCRGTSPEGREYCAVQTFRGFFEPYQVSFYIRDANGAWHWQYLAHQDNAWRMIAIKFTAKSIRVSRDGVLRKELPRRPPDLDLDYNCPAAFTVNDVAAFHQRRFDR